MRYSLERVTVIDGDTIKADILLGFGIVLKDRRIRLHGINAPEMSTDDGKYCRSEVYRFIAGKELLLDVSKDRDKYGRVLGRVYAGGVSISDWLLTMKLAEPYEG